MVTDPISDFLTRVRNAQSAGHKVVEIPASKIKKEITKILFDQGYILNYKFEDNAVQGTIKIALKYDKQTNKPAIKSIQRASRPGLRKYAGSDELPRVLNGLGIAIISTSKGVKGPKGELSQEITKGITIAQEGAELTVNRPSDSKEHRSLHGLYRALINNMVVGVSEGFTKQLELVGVGYRASHSGQKLELALGFSHGILMELPKEITLNTETEKGKNPIITLSSHDKQLLGMVVAKIRSFRKPEPYKGKGVRFVGENVRRKAGKSA